MSWLTVGPRCIASHRRWNKKLGPATGPAKETTAGKWARSFQHTDLAKPTDVTYDTATKIGAVDWADGPAGPPKIWPGNPDL